MVLVCFILIPYGLKAAGRRTVNSSIACASDACADPGFNAARRRCAQKTLHLFDKTLLQPRKHFMSCQNIPSPAQNPFVPGKHFIFEAKHFIAAPKHFIQWHKALHRRAQNISSPPQNTSGSGQNTASPTQCTSI